MEEILCFLFCSSQIDNPSPQTHHVVYAIVFQTPAQGFWRPIITWVRPSSDEFRSRKVTYHLALFWENILDNRI